MAEIYTYWKQNVYNGEGKKVDVAHFRGMRGVSRNENATLRYTGETQNRAGKVRKTINSAAARGAARNPAMRTQIQSDRAANRVPASRNNRRR